MSEFFDSFNSSLPEFSRDFGEKWLLVQGENPDEYDAICIEPLNVSSKNMMGGRFIDASTTIDISTAIYTASGVKKGDIVNSRGQNLAVLELQFDAIDDVTLICGPAQINLWTK